MDKRADRKSHRINGSKKNRIGTPLGIHDKNMSELHCGDYIRLGEYNGIILWHPIYKEYWMFLDYSKWYGENPYDPNSYGKGFPISMDDGARMSIELI